MEKQLSEEIWKAIIRPEFRERIAIGIISIAMGILVLIFLSTKWYWIALGLLMLAGIRVIQSAYTIKKSFFKGQFSNVSKMMNYHLKDRLWEKQKLKKLKKALLSVSTKEEKREIMQTISLLETWIELLE